MFSDHFKTDNFSNNQKLKKNKAMRIIELQNNGRKLAKQLLRLVDFRKGNNYESTHISVSVFDNHIIVSTFCTNEFGREWCNQNHTRVEKSDVPFFAAKKLGIV